MYLYLYLGAEGAEPSEVPSVVPVLLREIPCRLEVPHRWDFWM